MKKFLLFLLTATLAFGQNVNVQKAGDGTNAITGNLVVGSGRSITPSGTGDIRASSVSPTFVVPWNQVNKTGSSLADLQTRSASDLSSGTLPDARFPSILPAGSVSFNLAGGTGGVGNLTWNPAQETLDLGLNSQATLQIGQEQLIRVQNSTGTTLTDGQLVYISGSQGQRPVVSLAQANTPATSSQTIGMVTQTIADGAAGFVTVSGIVNNVNTNGYADGTQLWLSPTTPGGYTSTQPSAPNHSVAIGYVVKGGSAGGGSIFVNVKNGEAMADLHDVVITAPVLAGSTLLYDAATPAWRNARISAGTGLSATYGNATMTLANTGVTSISGTAGQVNASGSTGNVTLSLPSTITQATTFAPGSGNTALTITPSVGGILVNSGAVSNGTYPALQLSSSGAGWGSGMQFRNTTATTGRTYGIYAGSGGPLSFTDETALFEYMTVTGAASNAGRVNIAYTTPSTSTSSGAFTVAGGAGVAGALNVGGYISSSTRISAPFYTATGANTQFTASTATLEQASSAGGRLVVRGPDTSTQASFALRSTTSNEATAQDFLSYSAAGALSLNAGGSNQTITLTPSGTGLVAFNATSANPAGPNFAFTAPPYNTTYPGQITVRDSTALATNTGGGVMFETKYTGNTYAIIAGVQGAKETAVDGEYGGHLRLFSRSHLGALSERARVTAAGNLLIGTTTDVGDRQVVFSSGGAASATRYANGTTGVTSSDGLTVGVDSSGNGLLRSFDGPLTLQGAGAGITTPSAFAVTNSTASSSTSTGALTVAGGLGVAGAINSGDSILASNTVSRSIAVTRTGVNPSGVYLWAASSHPYIDFTSDTAGGYTWGRIFSNGSEALRIYNNNLAGITNLGNAAGLAIGGGLRVASTEASTSTTSGSIVTSGGLGVAGAGYFGDAIINDTTSGGYARWRKNNATSGAQSWSWFADNNGTLFLSAANDNFVGANTFLQFTRSGPTPTALTVAPTTASTSTTTGALVVSGGAGIAGRLYVGARLNVGSGSPFQDGDITAQRIYSNGSAAGTNVGLGTLFNTDSNFRFGARNDGSLVWGDGTNPVDATLYRGAASRLITDGQFMLNSANPILFLNETDQVADARNWGIQSEATVLKFRAFNDAISSATDALYLNRNGQVQVPATTASTSTSTGALVVSGGVGVAGNTFASGFRTGSEGIVTGVTPDYAASVANAATKDILFFGAAARGGLMRGYHDGGGTVTWQWGRYTGSFDNWLELTGFNSAASAQLKVLGTGASTSTTTGALVVSGGVGVAGAINATGNIVATNGRPVTLNGATGSVIAQASTGGWDGVGYRFAGSAGTVVGALFAEGTSDAANSVYLGMGSTPSSDKRLIFAATGATTIQSGGSNQNITLTPSGTGAITLNQANSGLNVTATAGDASLKMTSPSGGTWDWRIDNATGNYRLLRSGGDYAMTVFPSTRNVVIGNGTTDNGQRLQVSGTAQITGNTTVTASTASTSTSTGALVVSGGVGVAGNLNIGGNANRIITSGNSASFFEVQNNDSSGTAARSQINAFASGYSALLESFGSGYTTSNSAAANSGRVLGNGAGGFSIVSQNNWLRFWAGNPEVEKLRIYHTGTVGADFLAGYTVRVQDTTASTSTTTGALTVAGGLGVNGSVFQTYSEVTNSQNGQTSYVVRNANTGTTASAAFAATNGSYQGGLVLGGTGLSAVGPLRGNRGMLTMPFDMNYLSGYHNFWVGTTGAGHDPANAVSVFQIRGASSGSGVLHMPQNSTQGGTGTVGIGGEWRGATLTNNAAAASSTVASQVWHSWSTPTFAASNSSVTITDAATLYVQPPTAGTNVTLTNRYAIWTAAGGSIKTEGGLIVGSTGTWVRSVHSASASLDFPSISANSEATLTITVTGATVGDVVSLGWGAALDDGIVVKQYWVSATDTVSIRVRNVTGGSIDPASQTVRAQVTRF